MRIKYRLLFFLSVCGFASFHCSLQGQDMHLGQAVVSPTYINPAFAGSVAHFRAVSNSKYQWAGANKNINAQTLAFDYNWDYYSSGLGIVISQEALLGSGLKNFTIGGQYSFRTVLAEKLALKGGVQFGTVNRRLDYGKLVFGDQLSNASGQTAENVNQPGVWYFDAGAGLLLYSPKFWAGGSVSHLGKDNKPAPLYSPPLNRFEQQMRFSAHAGGKITVWDRYEKEFAFYPSVYWASQNAYRLGQAGLNVVYSPVVVGTWARQSYFGGGRGQTAVAILAGFKLEKFDLRYSYERALGGFSAALGATHELTLVFAPKFDDRYKGGSKFHKFIECPSN